jgi:ribulose-phosphate 3-epimerase
MAVICPTITAADERDYASQIDKVKNFAHRIHIDLMDGELAPSRSVDISKVTLPEGLLCDVHVMFSRPMDIIDDLIRLNPYMVIIHQEADVDHTRFARFLHEHHIKAGLALLQETSVQSAQSLIAYFDQVLIFGGKFGYQGGQADLGLIDKVKEALDLYPVPEIAWDGGVNDKNAKQLADAGVNVLNVGSFIQSDVDPKAAYAKILRSLIR